MLQDVLPTDDPEESNAACKVDRCPVIELRNGALFLRMAAATLNPHPRRDAI